MAENLNRFVLASILFCATCSVLAAEWLPDPTRPAREIYSVSGGAKWSGKTVQNSAEVGLQSTIISPQRRAAVINGKVIELGEKIGDSVLVEVKASSVVLRNAKGSHVMKLFSKVQLTKIKITSEQEIRLKTLNHKDASTSVNSEQNEDGK